MGALRDQTVVNIREWAGGRKQRPVGFLLPPRRVVTLAIAHQQHIDAQTPLPKTPDGRR